jgi:proline dehydrogenase
MGVATAVIPRAFALLPRPIAARLARPYIAGDCVQDAVDIAAALDRQGISPTLDILGESVRDPERAHAYTTEYISALQSLVRAGLRPHVSVKPSALGSLVDWQLCQRNVRAIAEAASALGGLVCIDMEWSHQIDQTIDLYRALRTSGVGNVTMVIQARLHRSQRDLRDLATLHPHVRVCKGIYREPRAIAFEDPEAIRQNFVFCVETILRAGGYPAIATHDEALVFASLARLKDLDVDPDGYEFQMLLGVRSDLARMLVHDGHPVRLYIPYGSEWQAYTARRLKESPQIRQHVVKELLRSARRGDAT